MKDSFHWTEKLFPFESVSEKIEENGFHQQKWVFFLDICLRLIAIMVSRKYEWKNIVSTKHKILCHSQY